MTNTRSMSRQLRSVRDVANELGLSDGSVRRLIASGQLSAVRLGKVWRIDPASVEALRTPTT